MRRREILLLSVSGVGFLCLAASFVLPCAAVVAPPYAVAVASMWKDLRVLAVALALGFVGVAAVPVIRRKRASWLFPLFGSIPLTALGLLVLGYHFFSGHSAFILLTVSLFTIAGLLLLCEALMARLPG